MQKADHIHLRCPGNIGLLGCVQIFFLINLKQLSMLEIGIQNQKSWTYILQQKILRYFLTKNMQVLIYGGMEWTNKTVNPFTASYYEEEKKLE
jgi:hypothetical protein